MNLGNDANLSESSDVIFDCENCSTDTHGESNSRPAEVNHWYLKDPDLQRAEIQSMLDFKPDAEFDYLSNGQMYWNIKLCPVVCGKRKDWMILIVYDENHPKSCYGGSIKVYPVIPNTDEILEIINSSSVVPEIVTHIPHTFKDKDGQIYLDISSDKDYDVGGYDIISAASRLRGIMRWIAVFELGLTDPITWSKFAECWDIEEDIFGQVIFPEKHQSDCATQTDRCYTEALLKEESMRDKKQPENNPRIPQSNEPNQNRQVRTEPQRNAPERQNIRTSKKKPSFFQSISNSFLTQQKMSVHYLDGTAKSGQRPNPKCQKILISNRAMTQIYNETQDKDHMNKETGGLLLGHYINGAWCVIESSDPGYKGVFQRAYHESDEEYVNHVCDIISRTYKYPLNFLGMWHRHPGSMDSFSGTDDITNNKYAISAGNGCISLLVNKDPKFRITPYYVEITQDKIIYTKTDYVYGDAHILQVRNDVMAIASKIDIDGRK